MIEIVEITNGEANSIGKYPNAPTQELNPFARLLKNGKRFLLKTQVDEIDPKTINGVNLFVKPTRFITEDDIETD